MCTLCRWAYGRWACNKTKTLPLAQASFKFGLANAENAASGQIDTVKMEGESIVRIRKTDGNHDRRRGG